jgi:hypothetical protein
MTGSKRGRAWQAGEYLGLVSDKPKPRTMSAQTTDLVSRFLYCGAALTLVGGLILLVAGSSSTLRAFGGVYVLIASGLIAVARLLRSPRRGSARPR